MTRRVLVVEDDESLAELEVIILRGAGFEPTVMHSGGGAAAAWVHAHHPQLVLLDLMLPDVSGYDVCQQLKLDRDTNLTPIILVTARSLREDMLHGLEVGANFYLTKPFTGDQLMHAIDHVLAWRKELERSGAGGELHFQLKSDTQFLEELNRLAASLFLFSGLNEDEVFQLTTAVREMGCAWSSAFIPSGRAPDDNANLPAPSSRIDPILLPFSRLLLPCTTCLKSKKPSSPRPAAGPVSTPLPPPSKRRCFPLSTATGSPSRSFRSSARKPSTPASSSSVSSPNRTKPISTASTSAA